MGEWVQDISSLFLATEMWIEIRYLLPLYCDQCSAVCAARLWVSTLGRTGARHLYSLISLSLYISISLINLSLYICIYIYICLQYCMCTFFVLYTIVYRNVNAIFQAMQSHLSMDSCEIKSWARMSNGRIAFRHGTWWRGMGQEQPLDPPFLQRFFVCGMRIYG